MVYKNKNKKLYNISNNINTNRNFIGFAIDKHYCDIANERIQKALAEKEVGK